MPTPIRGLSHDAVARGGGDDLDRDRYALGIFRKTKHRMDDRRNVTSSKWGAAQFAVDVNPLAPTLVRWVWLLVLPSSGRRSVILRPPYSAT